MAADGLRRVARASVILALGVVALGTSACAAHAASSRSTPARRQSVAVLRAAAPSDGGKGGGADCANDDGTYVNSSVDGTTYCTGYCTWYVYEQEQDPGLKYMGDASSWLAVAQARSIPTGSVPLVGAIAWWGTELGGGSGHVAVVTAATATTVTFEEMNALAGWNQVDTNTVNLNDHSYGNHPGAPDAYIYVGAAAGGAYLGDIVQWSGDTKSQKTAWLVVVSGGHTVRNWIPTAAMYYCLKNGGAAGPVVLPASVLSGELPDQTGVWASCGGGGSAPPPTSPPTTSPPTTSPPSTSSPPATSPPATSPPATSPPATSPPSSAPPPTVPPSTPPATTSPAPSTYAEATGDGPVHTWSDPNGPSGDEGPTLAANTVYQVTCWVTATPEGPAQDAYWYLIAGTGDYGSADAFCDEGATLCPNGFAGTPNVDPNVPKC